MSLDPQIKEMIAQRTIPTAGGETITRIYTPAGAGPFPDGLDDCYATLEWVEKNVQALNVDAKRLQAAHVETNYYCPCKELFKNFKCC